MRGALDDGGSLVHLRQLERARARDVDQDAARAIDRALFQER